MPNRGMWFVIKELPFDDSMVKSARRWSDELGGIKNSITKGKGNAAGRLGEIALANYLLVDVQDHKEYDIIYQEKTIEVKTKRRSVAPQGFYEASVARTSTHQSPDHYAFISLEFKDSGFYGKPAKGMKRRGGKWYKNLQKIWLCGDIDAEEFWKKAILMERGDRDESNNFTTHVDMFNIRVDQLGESF